MSNRLGTNDPIYDLSRITSAITPLPASPPNAVLTDTAVGYGDTTDHLTGDVANFSYDDATKLLSAKINEKWIQETNYLVVDAGGRGDYTTLQAALSAIASVGANSETWTVIYRTPTTEIVSFSPGSAKSAMSVHVWALGGATLTGRVDGDVYGALHLHNLRISYTSNDNAKTVTAAGGNAIYLYDCIVTRSHVTAPENVVIGPAGGTVYLYNCTVSQTVNSAYSVFYGPGTVYAYNCILSAVGTRGIAEANFGASYYFYYCALSNATTDNLFNTAGGGSIYLSRCQFDTTRGGTYTILDGDVPSGGVPAAHNILSAQHGDTLTASVVRGDLIVGNATPKWARLAIGAANKVLQSDGTDAAWSTNTIAIAGNSTINGSLIGNISGGGSLATTSGQTYTFPTTGGTVPLGTGTSPRVTFWSGTNTVSSDANLTWTTGAGVVGLNVLGGKMMVVRGDAGDRSRFNTYISAGSVSIDAYDDVAAAYIPVTYNYGEYIRMNSNLASGYTRFDVNNNRIGVFKSTGLGIFTTFPASPIHALTDGDTAGVKSVVILDATRTSAGANGDGGSITLRGKSSTTAAQQMVLEQWLYTDATHASRTTLYRGTTTGNATQTGYYGAWAHNAVSNTAITIIPDGTGDVASVGSFVYTIKDNTAATTSGGVAVLNPGGAAITLLSDGTDTVQITCAANGSVTIARSAGTHTFSVSLWGTWQ